MELVSKNLRTERENTLDRLLAISTKEEENSHRKNSSMKGSSKEGILMVRERSSTKTEKSLRDLSKKTRECLESILSLMDPATKVPLETICLMEMGNSIGQMELSIQDNGKLEFKRV